MREIATNIRTSILAEISPLVVSGVTIPVYDTFLPPTVSPATFMGGQAYVLITDQNEAETTNNDCSIRQTATVSINIITKFPQGSGGKKASETISNVIQQAITKENLTFPADLQLVNLRKAFSRVQIEEGSSQIGYQKIIGYTLDIFQVS
jgi:hypothetical protein